MLHHYLRSKDSGEAVNQHHQLKPFIMSSTQSDQPFSAHKSSQSTKSPPQRSQDLHSRWTADYLKDLRSNRPSRPGGARPLPLSSMQMKGASDGLIPERASSALGMRGGFVDGRGEIPERSASALSQRPQQPSLGYPIPVGRPVARPPAIREVSAPTAQTADSVNSHSKSSPQYKIPYYERGQRWMERKEMSSLRQALEDKDLRNEQKVHAAAQDEASDLVWKHQNPDAPYPNPDRPKYKEHLKKGSHARSQSIGPFETLFVAKEGSSEGSRSASDGSDSNRSGRSVSNGSQQSDGSASSKGTNKSRYSSLSFSMRSRRLFWKGSNRSRNASGESAATLVRNVGAQIYEEPEDITVTLQDDIKPLPLKPKPRNTSYGSRIVEKFPKPNRTQTAPMELNERVSTTEIHKNPPSQSHNAHYSQNLPTLSLSKPARSGDDTEPPRSRNGKEIRSDDIRAATSMRLSDRSNKLPSPTVVSDRPGRPIVSFDEGWKPRQKDLKNEAQNPKTYIRTEHDMQGARPQLPTASTMHSAPAVPTIHIDSESTVQAAATQAIPTISFPDEPSISISADVPSISISPEVPSISIAPSVPSINVASGGLPSRPLPYPVKDTNRKGRPLPRHAPTAPVRSAPHWSPASHRAKAQCSACALPISGRIVSAASQRFHPECFTCFQCGEMLECVAFYPEPEKHRSERLARIQARLNSESIPADQPGFSEADDGDDSLRFYCHLDFHENFSPRCRSCKTPIEGEVILACGGEWHAGHFFCAECGDPFEKDMPFVEKDGFAWCVGCHTKRYSGKCAGCRKAITDLVVNALDKEWHEGCFCCKVSLLDLRDLVEVNQ